MRNPLRLLLLCLLSCLCLVSAWAADLKTCREVYQKNSEGISQTYQPKFAGVQQQYQKALEALRAQAKCQGDLAKTMASIAEIERFQKAKSLPASSEESLDWRGNYAGAECDPRGAASGSNRVLRGGSWRSHAGNCRSACRDGYSPNSRYSLIGFRVACTLP
jgi:hypothetical protein